MKIIDQSVKIIYPSSQKEWIKEAKFIELAARNCYKSEDKITDDSWKKMVSKLKENNHGAMLEFGTCMIKLTTNQGVLRELTRHRAGISFSCESTRYCNYSKGKFGGEITVIRPSDFCIWGEKAQEIWKAQLGNTEETYLALVEDLKLKPEQARDILNLNLKCDIFIKVNFRELLHIINLRTSPAAHSDIRTLFTLVRDEIHQYLPELF